MEAVSYNEPNQKTLMTSWDNEELQEQTKVYLDSFFGYNGVNNHTGSKFTQDKDKMTVVLKELKSRNLNFIDSVTINNSVAHDTAVDMGVPSKKRNIFIDHKADVDYIYRQLLKAEALAMETGSSIVIGHPRKDTITAIEKWLPTLEEKGIKLIPISKVY